MAGLACNHKQALTNLALVLPDPALASRLDPLLCFSFVYFPFSSHSMKASVLTTLMRWPLTRRSALSSMPNPMLRLVFSASSTCKQHLPVDSVEEVYLQLVFMTTLVNLLSQWLSLSLLFTPHPLTRICIE